MSSSPRDTTATLNIWQFNIEILDLGWNRVTLMETFEAFHFFDFAAAFTDLFLAVWISAAAIITLLVLLNRTVLFHYTTSGRVEQNPHFAVPPERQNVALHTPSVISSH